MTTVVSVAHLVIPCGFPSSVGQGKFADNPWEYYTHSSDRQRIRYRMVMDEKPTAGKFALFVRNWGKVCALLSFSLCVRVCVGYVPGNIVRFCCAIVRLKLQSAAEKRKKKKGSSAPPLGLSQSRA